jgi:hypothetical protein
VTLDERITFNASQCGGRACIRGMRIRVADILEMLAQGVEEKLFSPTSPILKRKTFVLACTSGHSAAGSLELPRDALA